MGATVRLPWPTLIAACLMGSLTLLASQAVEASAQDGAISARARNSRNDEVVARLVVVDSTEAGHRSGWRWGSFGSSPSRIIEELKVVLNGKEIFVPLSAYVDLGNPKALNIEVDGEEFVIKIAGGETGESYVATLTVRDGYVTSRRVSSRAFPQEAWEATKYKYNLGDGR